MKIVSGIDLVYIPSFKKALKSGGENFLRRIFLEREITHLRDPEHLAGIFAAKEAIMKALSLEPGSWHDIHITYSHSGAPKIKLLDSRLSTLDSSLSISHDGNYVVAQFLAILK